MAAETDFQRSVFVCSKPLQFFMCASIVRRYSLREAVIFIVTSSLADADGFIAFLRSSNYGVLFGTIETCTSHQEAAVALRELTFDTLFVEDDRVSLYMLFAPLKTKTMSVFEEGVGTYRGDYRVRYKGLRWLKWRALSLVTGCGLQFGDGRKTDYVLVQHPDLYGQLNPHVARKALPAGALLDELARGADEWAKLIRSGGIAVPKAARVALILGTWGGAAGDIVSIANARFDDVYYKPHPHDGITPTTGQAHLIGASWVPAEIYVDYLARRCDELIVYHYSSTACTNCLAAFDNVTFVDLLSDWRFTDFYRALLAKLGGADATHEAKQPDRAEE